MAALAATVHHGTAAANPRLAMPGLVRGKVVAIGHSGCVVNGVAQPEAVREMLRAGMRELTGARDYVMSWRRFAGPSDVVGIKVNPNGNHRIQSSPALVMEVVDGLMRAGVRPDRIIVFERYNLILSWIRSWFPEWLQLEYASQEWTYRQQEVLNYDQEHFVDYPEVLPDQDPNDPVARRSHLTEFITKRVTRLINVAVLKTHQASGVTLALKNMSHGLVNNVNRSHDPVTRNLTGSFIPAVVSHPMIRSKCVLHIVDGCNGLYHGGPYGSTQHVWPHKKIYIATDPVAVDRVGWRVIDEQRALAGLPALAFSPADPPFFNFADVQPQHIEIAGALGLGEWRDDRINLVSRQIG
ncbi:MAG: DUF362 domain-containing protein [Bryobacterales bacterium]|nr:DUF362 domain-containing protein [Bryobacterales bacterium]